MECPKVVCKDFMYNRCVRENCKFLHDPSVCFYYWKTGECNRGERCERSHQFTNNKQFRERENQPRQQQDISNQQFVKHSHFLERENQPRQRQDISNQQFVERSPFLERKNQPRQQQDISNQQFVERSPFLERENQPRQRQDISNQQFVKRSHFFERENQNVQYSFGEYNNQNTLTQNQGRFEENRVKVRMDNGKKARGKVKEKLPKQNPKKNKDKYNKNKRKKNTECFEPMTRPVDMRIVYDLNSKDEKFEMNLTSRDVLLVPNLFNDFKNGELYNKLVEEIEACDIEKDQLLKLWHGNDKIEGTHLIANDRTNWKEQCPTFNLIINRLKEYFSMDIKATRFNWYKDTSQWKAFHHDAASIKPEKAATQNFTVAISFGATRDAAFEHAETKTVISMPQPDSTIYAFARDVNIIWRHGILQDIPVRNDGRISVIAWGWVQNL